MSLDITGAGTFSTGIKTTNGSFTGDVTSPAGTFATGLKSSTGSFSGAITTNAVGTFSGGVKSTTGSFSSTLNCAGNIQGGASSVMFMGTLTGNASNAMSIDADVEFGDSRERNISLNNGSFAGAITTDGVGTFSGGAKVSDNKDFILGDGGDWTFRHNPNSGGINTIDATAGTLYAGIGGGIEVGITTGKVGIDGVLNTKASATGATGLNVPHGVAPTSPVDGDMWTTTAGLYVRINGATIGPLTGAA